MGQDRFLSQRVIVHEGIDLTSANSKMKINLLHLASDSGIMRIILVETKPQSLV